MFSFRINLFILMIIAIFIFLQYRLWFDKDGVNDLIALKKNLKLQIAENDRLRQQNMDLLSQVQRLKTSHEAMEGRARNELGMIKKDEIFYQVIK